MKYKVKIQELLEKVVEIDASSENEAIEIASGMWACEEIKLTTEDWSGMMDCVICDEYDG